MVSGPATLGGELEHAPARPRSRAEKNVVLQSLEFLASLKLTVILFALSLVLVLVGTLAQDKVGIWEVVQKYFRSYFVHVPFNVFFPKAWTGTLYENVWGGFWFFGGRTLGIALALNLVAAHLVRWKVRGKGAAGWAGGLIFSLGVGVCYFIIQYGSIKGGIQDKVAAPVWLVWYLPILVTIGVMSYGIVWTSKRLKDVKSIRNALWLTEVLIIGLAVIGLIMGPLDGAYLRILWQLEQGTIGGVLLLLGSLLLFERRAGIVVIHLGIALLMYNELFVSITNNEQHLNVFEGEETSIARDIRSAEIAITDRSSATEDLETIVSQGWLVDGQTVPLEKLPFDLKVERFFINSTWMSLANASDDARALAPQCTQGVGRRVIAIRLNPVTGADTRSDAPSVYVTVLDKKGIPLATLLLPISDLFSLDNASAVHPIDVDGKRYFLELRYAREIKPYSVQLLDVTQETYVGTSIPSHYASIFRIRRQGESDVQGNIQMNEPLRYGGETFYQSGYQKDESGREVSTFQVVTNTGWMMPYVACMIVAIGMVHHFLQTLVLRMGARRSASIAAQQAQATLHDQAALEYASAGKPPEVNNAAAEPWWPTWVALGVMSVVVLGTASRYVRNSSEFDFVSAGKIPVTQNGRIMPLDSMARETLRNLSKLETTRDKQGARISAMQWYLDVVTETESAKDYPVFKIQDPETLASLGLELRSGGLFSMRELEKGLSNFADEVERITQRRDSMAESAPLNRTEQAMIELANHVRSFRILQRIHQLDSQNEDLAPEAVMESILIAAGTTQDTNVLPLIVPAQGLTDRGWETLAFFEARRKAVDFIKSRLGRGEGSAPEEFSVSPAEATDMLLAAWTSGMLREEYGRLLLEKIRATNPSWDNNQILAEIRRQGEAGTLDEQILQRVEMSISSMINSRRGQIEEAIRILFSTSDGTKDAAEVAITQASAQHRMSDEYRQMLVAYRGARPSEFNQQVAAYQTEMKQELPDLRYSSVALESLYSRIAPFYLSTMVYLIAAVLAAFSWAFPQSGLRRAALGLLIFALCIHTLGIVARVVISERPPVTNLYSSALFIGWSIVVFAIVIENYTRMGVGAFLGSKVSMLCLLIASGLAVEGDTFAVMQAVLDTQFWLATHVICITLGYATTFLAGFVGIASIVWATVSSRFDKNRSKQMAGITYGMVCFSLLFSFVGTVLGGLWADDSWGRFWGWDPKENGALIIVLWNALVLHARWGGMIKDRGVAVLAMFGNIVTAWSWFGTNQLGIGLHSYGFNKTMLTTLAVFVVVQLGLMMLAWIPPRNAELQNRGV